MENAQKTGAERSGVYKDGSTIPKQREEGRGSNVVSHQGSIEVSPLKCFAIASQIQTSQTDDYIFWVDFASITCTISASSRSKNAAGRKKRFDPSYFWKMVIPALLVQ